jgi:hypothetical protein
MPPLALQKMLAYFDAQNWTPVVSKSLREAGSSWIAIVSQNASS